MTDLLLMLTILVNLANLYITTRLYLSLAELESSPDEDDIDEIRNHNPEVDLNVRLSEIQNAKFSLNNRNLDK